MDVDQLYIVVQAGGRGSRLRHHTWNKPKCLVSIRAKPVLYHLFDLYKNARFIIIGDYLFDTLEEYLRANSPSIDYELVKANGKGTLAGIADALKLIPANARLLLVWSDLILQQAPNLPLGALPVVMTTDAFTCRWTRSKEGFLQELAGTKDGIPGIFFFPRADKLLSPPDSGEFLKWFSSTYKELVFQRHDSLEEVGDFQVVENENNRDGFCRFFNRVDINEEQDLVVKQVIDEVYREVHANEIAWYQQAALLGFRRIPHIYSISPLTMRRIKGIHAYNAYDYSDREKGAVLADYLDTLISLHDLKKVPSDAHDISSVYIQKTINRVEEVSNLIPFFESDSVTVNGKKCKNIFKNDRSEHFKYINDALQVDVFVPIHGDPTFSNTIIDRRLRVWFIDPRGSFAKPGIFGDAWYDFAKVFYSAVGGYDGFNRRKFKLYVDENIVEVLMDVSPFAGVSRDIFNEYFGKEQKRIELLHGLIWLALSGYVKDDIDSIIGSFALGLYWIDEGLQKL